MLCTRYGKDFLDYLSGRINNSNIEANTAVYAGLATDATVPASDGTGITEPVGNGYARVLVGYVGQSMTYKMSAAIDNISGEAEVSNASTIFFPKATGAWGTITHLVLFTAAAGGYAMVIGELTTPIVPIAGEVPIIEPGNLVITLI